MNVRVWCSPDADDLFMMRALMDGSIDTGDDTFFIETAPTDALNRLAGDDHAPDVCAISVAHYPSIAHRYRLLPHGGSVGEGYGPIVVSKRPAQRRDLSSGTLAIPGETTTAWLVLRLLLGGDANTSTKTIPIVPYQGIFDAVRSGDVDFGLVIHEGRLNYRAEGVHKVVDIGAWWAEHTGGLPLPLGANAMHRRIPEDDAIRISGHLRRAIQHGFDHRDAAIDWLLARGTALPNRASVDRYLSMYANQRTLDYGEDGRRAIGELFAHAHKAGLVSAVGPVDFVG